MVFNTPVFFTVRNVQLYMANVFARVQYCLKSHNMQTYTAKDMPVSMPVFNTTQIYINIHNHQHAYVVHA